jgi:hypothetical protein
MCVCVCVGVYIDCSSPCLFRDVICICIANCITYPLKSLRTLFHHATTTFVFLLYSSRFLNFAHTASVDSSLSSDFSILNSSTSTHSFNISLPPSSLLLLLLLLLLCQVGDVRGNVNPGILSMHGLLVLEHNRLCDELSALMPSTSFQTRKILDFITLLLHAHHLQYIFNDWIAFCINYFHSLLFNTSFFALPPLLLAIFWFTFQKHFFLSLQLGTMKLSSKKPVVV